MIKYTNNIYKGHESAKNIIRIGSDFEKSAYEMADPVKEFIETLKPDKGTTYDWVNAMGAGEVYGANSRGDWFPRQELIQHHKTFETNPAHVYVQHNNKDPQIKLGDVLFSHYNNDTDRVELIQSLEESRVKKYAPSWVKYALQNGENYNTSMGTKVAYDVCSVCDQKNKTVADYCGHLKTAMNDWVDGKHVHAINVAPNFFDNSIVMRGADKIARKLSKVASADDFDPTKTLLTDNDFHNINKKYFFLSDSFNKQAASAPYINESNLPLVSKSIYGLNNAELNVLSGYPLENILGTFKQADIELLPYEYQYLTLKALDNTKLAEDLYAQGITFIIPDIGNGETIKLGTDINILENFSSIIPYKTSSKPFMFYKNLLEPQILFTNRDNYKTAAATMQDDLLTYIGKTYTDYLNTELTKEASIIDLLISMFFGLPDIVRRAESKSRLEHASAINRFAHSQTNRVPILNPLFKNEFLEKNSSKWEFIKKHKTPLLLGGAVGLGAAGTSYLAGDAVKKELEGDPEANNGIGGMARKNPIAMGAGITAASVLGYKGVKRLFKKANMEPIGNLLDSNYINNYKEFLSTQSPEFILELLDTLPEDIFKNICYK